METDFLASGNSFLPFSQTAVNCCQWKQFFLQLEHFFVICLQFICLLETVFLYSKFLLLIENITKILGKSDFKDEPYSCKWTSFFFDSFRYSLKLKPCFRIVKTYFSIFFIQLMQTSFLPAEKVLFWLGLFCCY